MNFKQSVKRSHHIRQDDLKITILTKKKKKKYELATKNLSRIVAYST